MLKPSLRARISVVTTTAAALAAAGTLAVSSPAQAAAPGVSRLDSEGLRVVATRDLPRLAFDVGVGSGPVFTANSFGVAQAGALGAGSHDITKIGSLGAQDIAVDPTSSTIFATGVTDTHLYRVDRDTGAVTRSAAQPDLLFQVAVDRRRNRVYAGVDGGVVAFDGRTLARLWTISLGQFVNPSDIAVDSLRGEVWVTTRDTTAYGLDGVTGSVAHRVSLPTPALAVTVDGARQRVFFGSYGIVYAVSSDELVGRAPLRGDASGLAINPATGNVYAVSALAGVIGHGYVTEIDGATYRRLGLVRLDGGATYIAQNASYTYVAAFASFQTPPRLYVLTG